MSVFEAAPLSQPPPAPLASTGAPLEPPPSSATFRLSTPTPLPSNPTPLQLHRAARRALSQQRRSTLATAVALLITLGIWSAALAAYGRFGEAVQATHPRLVTSLLALALVGAFPLGMAIRWRLLYPPASVEKLPRA